MKQIIDVTKEQRKTILALLAKYLPNTTVWVYGSRAEWTARPQSDLDLVVFVTPEENSRVSDLREAFEESNLPFRVDLFVGDEVPEQFRKQIEAEHAVLVKREERRMGGEWRTATLGEVVTLQRGFDLPTTERKLGSYPVIASTGPVGTHNRAIVQAPGVVIGRSGSLGGGQFIKQDFWPLNTTLWVKDFNNNDPRFCYFLLKSLDLGQFNAGSGVPTLNRNHIHPLPVRVPPLSEQRAIAHILGTLDDKIELNQRMNQTAEEMARALFKSWFVDFDPVRAKAAVITPPLRGSRQAKGASPQARRWGDIKRRYSPQRYEKPGTLRQARTDAEGLLWHFLRNKQLDGYKFRRQQPIGPYIADFACLSQKLLIELGGSQHAERHVYDEKRDNFLREKGYRVLRFWNNEVFEHCFGVLERVYETLTSPPPHQPSPVDSASACLSCGRRQATAPRGSDWSVERARAYLGGMDDSIADLFPDRLVDSELGPIPERWEVKALGECINLTMGQSPPGSTYNERSEGLPFFQGNADFGFRYPEKRRYCTAPARIAHPDDTLVSVRAPVGAINMAWEQCCIGRGVAALRHNSGSSSFTYYSAWVLQEEIQQYEHTGTVFGAINKSQFEALQTVEPRSELIEAFDARVGPIDARIRHNISEARNLTFVRDTLLPKLVSGEVQVTRKGAGQIAQRTV